MPTAPSGAACGRRRCQASDRGCKTTGPCGCTGARHHHAAEDSNGRRTQDDRRPYPADHQPDPVRLQAAVDACALMSPQRRRHPTLLQCARGFPFSNAARNPLGKTVGIIQAEQVPREISCAALSVPDCNCWPGPVRPGRLHPCQGPASPGPALSGPFAETIATGHTTKPWSWAEHLAGRPHRGEADPCQCDRTRRQ